MFVGTVMSRMLDIFIDEWEGIVSSSSSRRWNKCNKVQDKNVYYFEAELWC